jgi:hypothetical protein
MADEFGEVQAMYAVGEALVGTGGNDCDLAQSELFAPPGMDDFPAPETKIHGRRHLDGGHYKRAIAA